MSTSTRRLSVFVERVPFVWSELFSVERRAECRGSVTTWDAIIGGLRIVASWRQ